MPITTVSWGSTEFMFPDWMNARLALGSFSSTLLAFLRGHGKPIGPLKPSNICYQCFPTMDIVAFLAVSRVRCIDSDSGMESWLDPFIPVIGAPSTLANESQNFCTIVHQESLRSSVGRSTTFERTASIYA